MKVVFYFLSLKIKNKTLTNPAARRAATPCTTAISPKRRALATAKLRLEEKKKRKHREVLSLREMLFSHSVLAPPLY
jgi:hypothetical protein